MRSCRLRLARLADPLPSPPGSTWGYGYLSLQPLGDPGQGAKTQLGPPAAALEFLRGSSDSPRGRQGCNNNWVQLPPLGAITHSSCGLPRGSQQEGEGATVARHGPRQPFPEAPEALALLPSCQDSFIHTPTRSFILYLPSVYNPLLKDTCKAPPCPQGKYSLWGTDTKNLPRPCGQSRVTGAQAGMPGLIMHGGHGHQERP